MTEIRFMLSLSAVLSISREGKKSMIEQLSRHPKKIKEVLNIFTLVAREAGWHMGGTEQILFTGN